MWTQNQISVLPHSQAPRLSLKLASFSIVKLPGPSVVIKMQLRLLTQLPILASPCLAPAPPSLQARSQALSSSLSKTKRSRPSTRLVSMCLPRLVFISSSATLLTSSKITEMSSSLSQRRPQQRMMMVPPPSPLSLPLSPLSLLLLPSENVALIAQKTCYQTHLEA